MEFNFEKKIEHICYNNKKPMQKKFSFLFWVTFSQLGFFPCHPDNIIIIMNMWLLLSIFCICRLVFLSKRIHKMLQDDLTQFEHHFPNYVRTQ